MKRFALEHPFVSGMVIFVLIFLGGSLAGIVLGMLVMASHPCEHVTPNDPCDGAAMAAGMIWSLSSSASFIFGLVIAVTTYFGLRIWKKRKSYRPT
jgi:hypothetical protein